MGVGPEGALISECLFCSYVSAFGPNMEPTWSLKSVQTHSELCYVTPGRHFGGSWGVLEGQNLATILH